MLSSNKQQNMKKQYLFLLATILTLTCSSQITFEKGYYITSSGQKTECLIKNKDWKNNPTEFIYTLSQEGEEKKGLINTIKEFGIYNVSKYVNHKVDIDRSSENINMMSLSRNPIFKEEQLFLKVLVEGKANLYLYEDGSLRRFFYKTDTTPITQLVFKSYKAKDNYIEKNTRFRQQLLMDLKCKDISLKEIKKLDYEKKQLVNFFVKYNDCSGSEFINFETTQKKDLFNLTIRPGLNNSSLSTGNILSNSNINFGNKVSFRFGVEAEFIMPFNKNKWSAIIEPTYQYYKTNKIIDGQKINVDYKSIELPIGVRHYFFINDSSKIFINASYAFDLSMSSKIDFENSTNLTIKTNGNFAFGMGYNHNQKYSMEIRYGSGRAILGDYVYWVSDYNSLSLIFGYTIF